MFQVQPDRLFRTQKRIDFRFDDIFVDTTLIQCAIVTVILFKVEMKRLASLKLQMFILKIFDSEIKMKVLDKYLLK